MVCTCAVTARLPFTSIHMMIASKALSPSGVMPFADLMSSSNSDMIIPLLPQRLQEEHLHPVYLHRGQRASRRRPAGSVPRQFHIPLSQRLRQNARSQHSGILDRNSGQTLARPFLYLQTCWDLLFQVPSPASRPSWVWTLSRRPSGTSRMDSLQPAAAPALRAGRFVVPLVFTSTNWLFFVVGITTSLKISANAV